MSRCHALLLVFAFEGYVHGLVRHVAVALLGPAVAVWVRLERQLLVTHAILLHVVRWRTKRILLLLLVVQVRLLARCCHGSRHLVLLLLLELLHVAAVGILVLLWVTILGGLLAVRLVANWITHHLVWVAVHHRCRRMIMMLLTHALVKLRSCRWPRLLQVWLVPVVRVVHHAAAPLRLVGRHA